MNSSQQLPSTTTAAENPSSSSSRNVRWTRGKQKDGQPSARKTTTIRAVPFLLGSLVCLILIFWFGTNPFFEVSKQQTQNIVLYGSGGNGPAKNRQPPVIYMFDTVRMGASGVGTTSTRKLPYVWQQVWENAGWVPEKLWVSRHASEYTDIVQLLEGSKRNLTPAQKRHVYKYLAMASVGGGWVAHSNVLPLHPFYGNPPLPNNGKLTLYDQSFAPSLMSGNAQEWLRLAKRMAQHASVYSSGEWSEAVALHQLRHEIVVQDQVFTVSANHHHHQLTTTTTTVTILDNNNNNNKNDNTTTTAAHASPSFVGWVWNSQDCRLTNQKRVVHFLFDKEDATETTTISASLSTDPGGMVVKWLSMWLQACERSDYFLKEAIRDQEATEMRNQFDNNNPPPHNRKLDRNKNDDKETGPVSGPSPPQQTKQQQQQQQTTTTATTVVTGRDPQRAHSINVEATTSNNNNNNNNNKDNNNKLRSNPSSTKTPLRAASTTVMHTNTQEQQAEVVASLQDGTDAATLHQQLQQQLQSRHLQKWVAANQGQALMG